MLNIYKSLYSPKKRLRLFGNPRIKIMIDMVNLLKPKNRNILDIGCYDGTFLSLVKKNNPDNQFYGIEANEYGVKESLKKKLKVKQFYFDDKEIIPYESAIFDLIIAGEIIEHIYNTDFFLSEIYRLLKKDGNLLISTPNIASFGRRLMLFWGINPIIETSPNEPDSSGHIRYFTFRTLEKLLIKHGFRVISKHSDIVNFSSTGRYRSKLLTKIFPKIGQSLIYLVKKYKND